MSSLLEVLTASNVPVETEGHHHCRPGWAQIDCPFCAPGSDSFHMGVNLTFNYANCWRCGKHSLVDVLRKLLDKSIRECQQIVSELTASAAPAAKRKKHTGKLELPSGLCDLMPRHIEYLKGRGFNAKRLQKLWGIQGIGPRGLLRWRVFIPIHFDNEMVSWTTRSINKHAALRYISASENQESVKHKTILYGEDYCRHSIIVHEGAIDAWSVGPGATATCGIGISIPQIHAIAKYPRRVICFDSEPEAQKRAAELCALLEVLPGETYNVQLSGKDANSSPKREIRQLRKHFLE